MKKPPPASQELPPDYDFSQCFGIPAFSCRLDPECYLCPYTTACDWAAHQGNPDSKSGMVSYEQYAYSREVADNPASKPKPSGGDIPEYTRAELVELLAFLLRIDEYTVKLLSDIVNGDKFTAAAIAKRDGVSRQSIHQKLARAVAKYPEIAELIKGHLYRCKRIVRDGISERQRHPLRGKGIQGKKARGN